MSNFKTGMIIAVVLGIGGAILMEHQAKTKLGKEVLALRADLQQLVDQVAALQQDTARLLTSGLPTSPPPPLAENQSGDLSGLRAEVAQLREKLARLEQANAAISNHIAAATGASDPFIYPDSRSKKDYAFSGYTAPQSALQTVLWAITQSDGKAFRASLAPEMAGVFASQFQDLPEGVMPGGFKNGAMYQASGYRVLEETPISNEQTRLKVFLEGKPKIAIKLLFKRIGDEWKWAGNE